MEYFNETAARARVEEIAVEIKRLQEAREQGNKTIAALRAEAEKIGRFLKVVHPRKNKPKSE